MAFIPRKIDFIKYQDEWYYMGTYGCYVKEGETHISPSGVKCQYGTTVKENCEMFFKIEGRSSGFSFYIDEEMYRRKYTLDCGNGLFICHGKEVKHFDKDDPYDMEYLRNIFLANDCFSEIIKLIEENSSSFFRSLAEYDRKLIDENNKNFYLTNPRMIELTTLQKELKEKNCKKSETQRNNRPKIDLSKYAQKTIYNTRL